MIKFLWVFLAFMFSEVVFAADARVILEEAKKRLPEAAGKFFDDLKLLENSPKNIKIIRAKSGDGDMCAKTYLAALCLNRKVEGGREKAKLLLQEASEGDFMMAHLMLWVLYRQEKNQAEVERLTETIAGRHLHFCQYAVADYYLERNEQEKAIPFLKTAAELGDSRAHLKLGLFLGEQEEKKEEALCWLREAMSQGETEARKKLVEMADPDVTYLDKYLEDCAKGYAYGAVVHVVQAAQQGRVQALKILRREAGNDNGHALMALAQMHEVGLGVEKDWERAAGYYQRAHKQGALRAAEGVKRMAELGVF